MSKNIVQNDFDEIWSRWEPDLPNLAGKYDIDSIYYDNDGFKVILSQEGTDQKVQVLFPYGISSARVTEEGMELRLGDNLFDKYGRDFYRHWTFFKVEQSDYLKWLSVQSYEISDLCKVKHFVLLGANSILDIATAKNDPEIKILPSKEIKEKFTNIITMKKNGLLNQRNYSKDGQSVTELFDDAISTKIRGNKTE